MASVSIQQFAPRFHCDIYPFIYPSKFKASLQDKVTIITGAAGTIGKALAESFAVAGANLVLVYNRTKPPPEFEEHCLKLGAVSVTYVQCNVSELESCESLVKQALAKHGRVDILVNNAGANALGQFHVQDPNKFVYDVAVNLNGPYFLMRFLLPSFREQRSGCVLNITSRAGTVPAAFSTSYAASKAALINLTGCVQRELNIEGFDDIHMYALHPGGVKSEMVLNKYSDENIANLPEKVHKAFHDSMVFYRDSPHLNGMVCVALATGIAKEALKGKYFDVGHDLEDVVKQTAAIRADSELYSLHTTFLGEMKNDGGPLENPSDPPFDFPGY